MKTELWSLANTRKFYHNQLTFKTLSKMTQIEFFVTMKVTCEHDEQGYYGDQTLDMVKEAAIQLLQPNFHTIDRGVQLKKVEVEFHSDDDINNDNWDFCPDGTFTE